MALADAPGSGCLRCAVRTHLYFGRTHSFAKSRALGTCTCTCRQQRCHVGTYKHGYKRSIADASMEHASPDATACCASCQRCKRAEAGSHNQRGVRVQNPPPAFVAAARRLRCLAERPLYRAASGGSAADASPSGRVRSRSRRGRRAAVTHDTVPRCGQPDRCAAAMRVRGHVGAVVRAAGGVGIDVGGRVRVGVGGGARAQPNDELPVALACGGWRWQRSRVAATPVGASAVVSR